jgi:hypothetical protein
MRPALACAADDAHGVGSDEFGQTSGRLPEHPADMVPISHALTALVADATGFGVGVLVRAVRVSALRVEAASAFVDLDSFGPLCRFVAADPV